MLQGEGWDAEADRTIAAARRLVPDACAPLAAELESLRDRQREQAAEKLVEPLMACEAQSNARYALHLRRRDFQAAQRELERLASFEPPQHEYAWSIARLELAKSLGIKVYTIGAIGSGTQQRRSPFDFMLPTAAVDEPMLKQIASITGGQYFRATDIDSLAGFYEEIDKLETHKTGERSFRDNVWAAQLAMLVGLGFLMTELLLVSTRYRRVP